MVYKFKYAPGIIDDNANSYTDAHVCLLMRTKALLIEKSPFRYRPAYKAFKDDSSANFMMFFFVFFFQLIILIVQTIGLKGKH